MNRGNSLVQQQMMARRRSHSFWMPSLTPSQEMMFNSSSSSLSSSPIDFAKPSKAMVPNCHDLPEAWSQRLPRGFMEEEEGWTAYSNNINSYHNYQGLSALENGGYVDDEVIKQEDTCGAGGYNTTVNNQYNFHGKDQAEAQAAAAAAAAAAASRSHSWSNNNTTTSITTKVAVPGSSPRSCLITSFNSSSSNNNNNNSNSILDFSNYKSCTQERNNKHHHGSNDHHPSDQCNSSYSGAALKKARIQASSAESSLKVRKEKLGDRIAALHQLVSPFGKTDTASVLSEAIAHIRFLQAQVEALSSPYLGGGSRKNSRQCGGDDDGDEARDLRSRGLCLVPAPFTLHGGRDNGADFWTPSFGVGF